MNKWIIYERQVEGFSWRGRDELIELDLLYNSSNRLITSCFASDIQEFYELTLLDDTKSVQQKTVETLQIASKWEQEAKFSVESALVRNITFSLHTGSKINHAIAPLSILH